jgi:hypothetical protein
LGDFEMCPGTGVTAYWATDISQKKARAKAKAKAAEKKAKNLPKVYNYYCPHCLFQTNDYSKKCPECQSSKLIRTHKNQDGGSKKKIKKKSNEVPLKLKPLKL